MSGSTDAQLQVALAEIERLRARIAELEAALYRAQTRPLAQNYPNQPWGGPDRTA